MEDNTKRATKIVDMPNPQVEQQFTKGPEPTLTREQIDAILEEELPYMRKREEHNRLQLAMIEQDVLLGRMDPKQVPGLLGMRLMVEEIQSFGYLASWKAGQEAALQKSQEEATTTQGEA